MTDTIEIQEELNLILDFEEEEIKKGLDYYNYYNLLETIFFF